MSGFNANSLFGWSSGYDPNYQGTFTPSASTLARTAPSTKTSTAAVKTVNTALADAANKLTSGINKVASAVKYPTATKPVSTTTGASTSAVSTAAKTMAKTSSEILANWDQYAAERTMGYLDNVAPQWRQIVSTTGANIQNFISTQLPTMLAAETQAHAELVALGRQYLTGAIPNDVASQVRRVTGERSAAAGATGQQAQNLVARDLGLTSIDMQKFGADLLAGTTAKVNAVTAAAAVGGKLGTDYATASRNLLLEGASTPGDLTGLATSALNLTVPSANATIASKTSLAQADSELAFNAAANNRADLFSGLIAQWNAQMGMVAGTGAGGIA